MSNLGAYQDFTTAAGKAGGVPKLLAIIEKNAVNAAKPGLLAKGGAGGAVATLLLGAAGLASKRYYDTRKAEQVAAAEAKRRLEVEFHGETDEPDSDA